MPRKKTLNRQDFIGDYEEENETKQEDEEQDEDEQDEDEDEGDADGESEGDADLDDEEAPKPKKKAAAKKAPVKRTRSAKVVRTKAVWIIYDNSSKTLETFPYSQRAQAEAFLEQKNVDKKGCYIQLVKVPMEEEKEKEEKKEKKEKK